MIIFYNNKIEFYYIIYIYYIIYTMYDTDIGILCHYITDNYQEITCGPFDNCGKFIYRVEDFIIEDLPPKSTIIVIFSNFGNWNIELLDESLKTSTMIGCKFVNIVEIRKLVDIIEEYTMKVEFVHFINSFAHQVHDTNRISIGDIMFYVALNNYRVNKDNKLYYLYSLNEICEKFPEIYKHKIEIVQKLAIDI